MFLSGAGSFDPDGDALTYSWTQLDGPVVILDDASTATPNFTLPAGDTSLSFRFQLIVNDGALDSLPAETLVTGNATATSPLPIITTGVTVTDGTASGSILWPGRAGDLVVIQASTDLEIWTDLVTATVGSIPVILFSDAEAGLYPHRFYRAASAPSGITLQAGNALLGDGVTSRVEVPHDNALNVLPLTVSFWLNSSDTDPLVRGLVTKYADGSLNGYGLFLYQGHVRGWYFAGGPNYIWDGGLGLDGGFVADGLWHFITLMVDDVNGRIYVDGSLQPHAPGPARRGRPPRHSRCNSVATTTIPPRSPASSMTFRSGTAPSAASNCSTCCTSVLLATNRLCSACGVSTRMTRTAPRRRTAPATVTPARCSTTRPA